MKIFYKKTGVMIFVISTALLAFTGCGNRAVTMQKADTAMGTIISQTLYVEEEAAGEKVTGEIISAIDDLEQELLSWRLDSSEIYRINESAGTSEGMQISEELAGIMEACLKVSVASEGAFDVTIGDVVRLWDIDSWATAESSEGFRVPAEADIMGALEISGYEKINLTENRIILPPKMQLDMGAVGKGIALDVVGEILKEHSEVSGAIISVGGSVLTYGSKPDGGTWNVGIVNPSEPSGNIGFLQLTGEWCVSTSGDYERYVEVNGERYHHIIDPATGRPSASGVRSVTILIKDGLYSDALSTACFILGEEKGMALAEEFGAEALFISENGEISMTEGMEEYFKKL